MRTATRFHSLNPYTKFYLTGAVLTSPLAYITMFDHVEHDTLDIGYPGAIVYGTGNTLIWPIYLMCRLASESAKAKHRDF
uniref:Uncharacterized protein n=1 Tax=Pithovirus LCPAC406 TaxID=2506599 RepID=A0A481ZEA1_9VIRU|nr:MAG: hypothetical protein LCPAC406_04010 [Pithovirus LCPAC406]